MHPAFIANFLGLPFVSSQKIRVQDVLFSVSGREGYPGIFNQAILMEDGMFTRILDLLFYDSIESVL